MAQQRVDTSDGISWHVETFPPSTDVGSSENVVLIPSGEGDCHILTHLAELLSAQGYHVTTFDMPGMSRTTASSHATKQVTPQLLAKQIHSLLNKLGIQRASFVGSSSGAGASLAMCALYPDQAKCGIIHEMPVSTPQFISDLALMSDEQIAATCAVIFRSNMIEQDVNDAPKKWDALGGEYHGRLAKNYVTWIRGYVQAIEVGNYELAKVPQNLTRRPIFWTTGALNGSDGGIWSSNLQLASAAGLEVDTKRLNCLHFPALSVTEDQAAWIKECIEQVKD